MADLDDFFAKKDKKKSKGKKFTTTEEIAKKLEEKKLEKPKKEKATFQSAVVQNSGDNNGTKPEGGEEEEWKEFEEEKKDYSGLKIQNLNIDEEAKSDNGDGETEGGEMEENEQGELVRKKKGPWRAISDSDTNGQTAAPPVPITAPAPKPTPPPATSKVYTAPHLRNPGMQPPTRTPRNASAAAPDIMNQDFFPTLSAASKETPVSWNRKKQEAAFEEVRNSKSHTNRDSRASQRLEIGNKFGALQSDHS